ncbi:hypothetical protein [Mycoplasma sp. SG1]|uniref:hypothetical protein n=1 Tax=Mycoplasma sp. SG1 TaxID=2810348 RepID=UPI0020243213|nr:hypothetical protein [Mycoplasma sp. SG1]URM53148.1 hypothetical protein JRW51_02255 [Mycoplasma sp. SG1]
MINDCGIKIIYKLNKTNILNFSISYFTFLAFYKNILTAKGIDFFNFLNILKSWKYRYIISSVPVINKNYYCLSIIKINHQKHILNILKIFKNKILIYDPTWGHLLVDKNWFLNNCDYLFVLIQKINNDCKYIFFSNEHFKNKPPLNYLFNPDWKLVFGSYVLDFIGLILLIFLPFILRIFIMFDFSLLFSIALFLIYSCIIFVIEIEKKRVNKKLFLLSKKVYSNVCLRLFYDKISFFKYSFQLWILIIYFLLFQYFMGVTFLGLLLFTKIVFQLLKFLVFKKYNIKIVQKLYFSNRWVINYFLIFSVYFLILLIYFIFNINWIMLFISSNIFLVFLNKYINAYFLKIFKINI